MMEERYHGTTQNRFYPDMSNVNKNITVGPKLISPPTHYYYYYSYNYSTSTTITTVLLITLLLPPPSLTGTTHHYQHTRHNSFISFDVTNIYDRRSVIKHSTNQPFVS